MWDELLLEAGLNEREVRSIMILGSRPKMKASELAKELNTTRLTPTTVSPDSKKWASDGNGRPTHALFKPAYQQGNGTHHPIKKATTRPPRRWV